MEYRLRRSRVTRVALLGAAAVILTGIGVALLDGDAGETVATLNSPTTIVAGPAVEPAASESAPLPTLPAPDEPAPTTVVESTATVTAPETTTVDTTPAQPTEPIAPPPDPRGHEEQVELGAIAIPALGVEAPLLEGIRLTTLDNGPGHWPGTAMPGEVGNVVVAAHRVSHGGPFRHIDQLVAGDVVEFTTDAGISTYTVTGTQIVEPDAIWIVDPTDTPTATLFACHPPGSVAQRIVVNLELAS